MRSLHSLPTRHLRRGLGALLIVALGGTTGCQLITGVPDVTRVETGLDRTTLSAGTSALATCTIYGKGGSIVHSSRVICGFSSSNPTIATVNSNTGVVTGVAPGTADIVSSARGKTDSKTITITPAPPSRIDINPPNLYLLEGRQQLQVLLYDANTQPLGARNCSISVANGNIVAVELDVTPCRTDKIFLRPLTAGQSTVTITVDGVSQSANITVLPPRVATAQAALQKGSNTILETEVSQVALALFAADKTTIPPSSQSLTYQSDDPTIASVAGNGTVTGVRAGTTTIRVLIAGSSVQASFTVTVLPIPAKEIRIQNRLPFIRLGSNGAGVQSARPAFVFDSLGRQITTRQVTYKSTDNSVFTVSSLGTVTGAKLGTARLIASADAGAVADTIVLTVTEVPIASVVVSPTQATISQGGTQQFTASLTDSLGVQVTGRPISWQSSNPSAIPVDATGVVTGVGAGTATITAIVSQVPGQPTQIGGTSQILVTPIAIATIDITPSSVTVKAGASTIVQIVPRDAQGRQLVGRAGNIVPTSDNPSIAQGDNAGNIRGLSVGTAHITYQAFDQNGVAQGAPTVVTVTVN